MGARQIRKSGGRRQQPKAMAQLKPPLIPEVIRDHILDRTLAYVHRWGTTLLAREKSVAEHSFFVARIARRICEILIDRGAQVGNIDILRVVDMALMHDEAEAFSGDIVRPFKKLSAEFERKVEESAFALLRNEYGNIPGGEYFLNLCEEFERKETIEAQIVTVADNIAGYAESQEEMQLGNELFRKGQYTFSLGSISYPWFSIIKDLLTFSGVV